MQQYNRDCPPFLSLIAGGRSSGSKRMAWATAFKNQGSKWTTTRLCKTHQIAYERKIVGRWPEENGQVCDCVFITLSFVEHGHKEHSAIRFAWFSKSSKIQNITGCLQDGPREFLWSLHISWALLGSPKILSEIKRW